MEGGREGGREEGKEGRREGRRTVLEKGMERAFPLKGALQPLGRRAYRAGRRGGSALSR